MGRVAAVVAVTLASCAVRQADSVNVIPKEHSFLGTSVEAVGDPRQGWLQKQVDMFCQEEFDRNCRTMPDLCTKAVARLEHGGTLQQVRVWRCYAYSLLRDDLKTAQCLTDCGLLVPCGEGLPLKGSAAYLSRTADILAQINAKKLKCNDKGVPIMSRLQKVLDDFCAAVYRGACSRQPELCGALAFARKDVGTPLQRVKHWRCYIDKNIVPTVQTAICATDCGEEVECGDGVIGGVSTDHLSFPVDIPKLINFAKKEFCPDGKMASIVPEVVDRTRLLLGGAVQIGLNGRCTTLLAGSCTTHQEGVCNVAIARKLPSTDSFMCYGIMNVELHEQSSLCLDDCGKSVPCLGHPQGEGLEIPDFDDLVAELVRGSCTPMQKAAQAVCDKLEDNRITLARKSPEGWHCLKGREVNYELSGACYDGCGGATKCPGSSAKGMRVPQAIPEIPAAASGIFLCQGGATCKAEVPRPMRCAIGELDGKSGRTVTIGNLHQRIIFWFGTCLTITIDPDEILGTASIVIDDKGKEGGFFTHRHNGNYVILIKQDGEDLTTVVTHSDAKDEGSYTVKGGWKCANEGSIEYTGVAADVVITLGKVSA